ncbi:MAG: class I SAM-dependent methyltransferase [Litoreibacter sp.]|nr:class I SAM-dependent methyltransferase [Litoreibacter sp.]
MSDAPNADQRAFWSEDAGQKWVAQQRAMDTLLAPVLDGVFERTKLSRRDKVLDIGCGAGTSTIRAAELVGPEGRATGLDISDRLLQLARSRAENGSVLTYLHADAATYDFEPEHYDHMISRFGVMFFDDTVGAFSNMIRALKPDAHICFATWGAIEENPYFKLAAKAAREVLGFMPKSDPDTPGPFAMREPERIIPTLEKAGLKVVNADRQKVFLTPENGLAGLVDICMQIGPAESAIRHFEADEMQQIEVRDNLAKNLEPFEVEIGTVHVHAEIIFYTARA